MGMIDREKVIRGLECCLSIYIDGLCDDCPYMGELDKSYMVPMKCKEIIMRDALALLKEQGWHTLTEDDDGIIHGLPGDDGQYLMTDGKDIWIDDYVDGITDGIILDSGRDIREIMAWKYMPELPKEKQK